MSGSPRRLPDLPANMQFRLPFPRQVLFFTFVGILSNISWLRGLRPPLEVAVDVQIRPAHDSELQSAIRLILATASGHPDEMQAREFLRLAGAHRQDAGGIWVAEQGGRLLSAVMPVVSPGTTMLLFVPAHLHGEQQTLLTRKLVDAVCA